MENDLSQPTQPATQNVLDPRRLGQQNSGFTDEDIADIVCILVPYSPKTRSEAARLAREGSPFIIGREDAENVDVDYPFDDSAGNFSLTSADPGSGPVFVLRLSSIVKNPLQGFTFGRNANRCDICFNSDLFRRLSNIHFRIFINEYGVLMLQDQSTNGTAVDEVMLKARRSGMSNMRTLNSGTKISILLQNNAHDLAFLVRVPRRHGEYEASYQRNLASYLKQLAELTEAASLADTKNVAPGANLEAGVPPTVGAGPGGHVDLFRRPQQTSNMPPPKFVPAPTNGLPREWNGSSSYNRVGEIGKGAFATVHKVTSKFDGKPYAAKELDKRRFVKNGVLDQKVENEMKIMRSIQHPSIVRYVDHFEFDDRLLIIVMEFVPGGDLGSFVLNRGALSENAVKDMARQLLDALAYLHRKNITHRDIKPDNILIDSESPFTVKLTDFGLSKMVDNEQTFLRTFCGTLLYCAPEVYAEYSEYDENGHRSDRNRQARRPTGQRYDHAVDIWSLGGVLYYCLTRSPPFPAAKNTSYTALLQRIMTTPLDTRPLRNANVSTECVDFLSKMLQRRPEHRATVDALLTHPWLTGSDISADILEQSASQLSIHDNAVLAEENPDTALGGPESDDEIYDDLLGGESQLLQNFVPDFELIESSRVNPGEYAQRTAHPQQRLFGEVNVSVIGSSGVFPEDRLNLPLSELGSQADNEQGSYSFRSYDSFDPEETFLTPRRQQRSQGGNGSVPASLASHNPEESHSVDQLNNLTFDVASQSLGGAESILGNLNMKSLATSNFKQIVTDFNSSKRKPALDSSDEFEGTLRLGEPTVKRFKSDIHIQSVVDNNVNGEENGSGYSQDDSTGGDYEDADFDLYAAVQPISRSKTGRQMDLPVHKAVYWIPGEPSSFHLQYPEMTQLQYDVFEDAASARKEDFRPGGSLLWDLAMKHFPPSTVAAREELDPTLSSRSPSAVSDTPAPAAETANGDTKENIMPRRASTDSPGRDRTPSRDLSSTLQPQAQQRQHAQIVVPVISKQDSAVARFDSVPKSVVQNISVPVTDSVTTWGRCPDNTNVYVPKTELKVPKYALKLLLWRSDGKGGAGVGEGGGRSRSAGYEPWKDLQPWSRLDTATEAANRYHFYISTKARGGIFVNQTPISSADPGQSRTASRYWTRLYDGDSVVVWHNYLGSENGSAVNAGSAGSNKLRTELVFRCNWGGSAARRPSSVSVALVDEATSRQLDEACLRAERSVSQKAEERRRMPAADRDLWERQIRIDEERQRSVAFERHRAAICEWHQQQLLQQKKKNPVLSVSPTSAPPVLASLSYIGNGNGNGNSSSVPSQPCLTGFVGC